MWCTLCWLVSGPIVHSLADPDLITAHQATYNVGVLHHDISLGNIMIVDDNKEMIRSGMLINWDLCKVINPSGKSSSIHHYTHTVSKFMIPVYCMLSLTFPARGHGSSWQPILFSNQTSCGNVCTFVHNLKFTFLVLLWVTFAYMPNTWSNVDHSSFLWETMSPRVYAISRGWSKLFFMQANVSMWDFHVNDNYTLTNLIQNLKHTLLI